MSDFKSEILPSGAELQISNEIYCISTTEHYVQVTKADIARMYGIAFPEKRRTGECCNTVTQTEVSDIDVGDMKQAVPGDKYEQRIERISKIHADRYNQGGRREYAGGPLLRNDPEHMRDEAEVTVAAQAQAIRGVFIDMNFKHGITDSVGKYLIEDGYVPAPKITCLNCGGKYKIHNCVSICDTCGKSIN